MFNPRLSSLGEVESISDLEITPLPDPILSPRGDRYCLDCDGSGLDEAGTECEECLGTGRKGGL